MQYISGKTPSGRYPVIQVSSNSQQFQGVLKCSPKPSDKMKFVLALALCVAFAVVLEAGIPISHTMRHDDFEPIKEDWHIPSYEFKYGVKDPKTGDHKEQWEHRHHDIVKGGYSLHDADGTHRVVEYTSDPKTGFHAIVKTEGHAEHPLHYGIGGGAGGGF